MRFRVYNVALFFLFAGAVWAKADGFVTYEVNDCRFNLCDYKLTKPVEKAIVFGVSLLMNTYRQTFGFEFPDDFKVNITIICGKEKFLKYQKERLGEIISDSGYYSGEHRETVVLRTTDSLNVADTKDMMDLIFHESNHMLLRYQIQSVPPWVNEGLSEYFSGFNVIGSNKQVYLNQNRQSWCKHWIKKGFPIELDKFLNMSHQEFHKFEKESKCGAGYTIGYSLVYFMMSSTRTENILKEILWDMKRSGQTGKTDCVKIINENYEGGIERFEKQWKRWIPVARESRPLRALRANMEVKRSSAIPDDTNN